jgi:RNase P/RNase MRP subunit p29
MLGLSAGSPVATPGVAPTAPPAPRPRKPQATVLGVALPGIAPLRAGDSGAPPGAPDIAPAYPIDDLPAPEVPPLVPPPAPLVHLPAPAPVRVFRRTGVPFVAVALIAGGLLVGGGLGLVWLSRDRPVITAQLREAADGADVLGLRCDPASCKNGTAVDVDGARATFTDGKCDLTLSAPLHIGDNPLAIHVDRPGLGRDEVVRLVVPMSFRIRADLAGLSAPKPRVSIRVEAAAGSRVKVDGKEVPLGADGTAVYSIDESAATEGPADQSRVVAVDVPYSITSVGGAPQTGTVAARFSVAPLRIDVPGAHAVVDRDHISLAGRAAKGATVTVDGAAAPVAPDGSFETAVALTSTGERTLQVRAGTPSLVSRTVSVNVKRVTSLAQEARAFERLKPLSYDAVMANPVASVGQPVAVEGEVMKARSSGHRSILIVDDRRGCAKGSCLARVALAQDIAPEPGTVVRAYGRVAPALGAPSGENVLEVDADFMVPNKR